MERGLVEPLNPLWIYHCLRICFNDLNLTFMNIFLFRFYQLNDGNITLAQDDAETYITLAANEVLNHIVYSR